ncbi:MAG: hypothetical protein KF754_14505 [Planctomycetes bacterium]|nr:hypothetical protein [Planctomycetota bacterium]
MRYLTLLALLCATPLYAATLTVTNLNDTGTGSLRDTVTAAATGDEIVFDPSLAGGTLTLTSGPISPGGKVLTITGLTAASGKPDITISGNDASRIFNQAADLTLNNLRLLDGHAVASSGGAVNNGGSVLTCTNCVFESCRTSSTSAMGGAIHGQVGTLTDCAFIGNSTPATHAGGALSLFGNSVLIVRCSFEGNSSGHGGAIYYDALSNAAFVVENSTFSGNQATSSSSAAGGGAIRAGISSISVNRTLTLTVSSSTFADNSATAAGQCILLSAGNSGVGNTVTVNATFNSCIFTDTVAPDMHVGTTSGAGTAVNFLSTGYNVCADVATWMYGIGDQSGTNPLLLPIADNGGLTRTHALDATSPAIGAGDPASPLTIDQRGFVRLDPDSGAFEFQYPSLVVTYGGAPVNDGGYAAVATLAEVGTTLSETCVFGNDASAVVDLTLTVPIGISGQANCTATVTTQPAATLAPGASSIVVFSVTPTAQGLFRFTVTLANNTADGSFTYDVIGYAATPSGVGGGGGGGGGGDDEDEGCSTAPATGLAVPFALALLLFVAVRRRHDATA